MNSALPLLYVAVQPDGLYIRYTNGALKLPVLPAATPTAAAVNLKQVLTASARTHLGRMFGPKA